MFSLIPTENILDFVREFGVVQYRHIYRFFNSIYDERTRDFIDDLLKIKRLRIIENGTQEANYEDQKISCCRCEILPHRDNMSVYTDNFPALDVLASVGAAAIKSYARFKNPAVVTFTTVDNSIYDVASLLEYNSGLWVNTLNAIDYQRVSIFNSGSLPDTIQHIAVIPCAINPGAPKDAIEKLYISELKNHGFALLYQLKPNGSVKTVYTTGLPDPIELFFQAECQITKE